MLYAKSDPIQSIEEHTKQLLKRLNKLMVLYQDEINKNVNIDKKLFWDTLEYACKYHDFGKVYTPFQNMLLNSLKQPQIKTELSYESVKHEQLSPLFIPYDLPLSNEYITMLYQAIYFHHNRYGIIIDEEYKQYIDRVIDEDISPNIGKIKKELNFDINKEFNKEYIDKVKLKNRIFEYVGQNKKLYLPYVLLKGLLNRLDYSASSGFAIEEDVKQSISDCTNDFFENIIFSKPNELQLFCKNNIDSNLLIIGSTGIGKTEAALLWSNNSKTFLTLPLVVSINAIYDRIKEKMGYKSVGLLHGSSYEYIEEKEKENSYMIYEQAKEFADKFTVCTIDQIFTFVFKFNGYERIYATLSYSKIVIDEIQAYSPDIVAVILKGIEMIYKIGGKFMIMTATLPTIYKDYLEERNIAFKEATYTKSINRHRVKSIDKDILDDIYDICENGKKSKVLVIVNTVDRAIETYKKISELTDNVTLLHARFIQMDKAKLEKDIKIFSDDRKKVGIWVTTQIVEASLDISFHYLYTELSTLDSLFQRLGRCYRSEEYTKVDPNIFVYLRNCSGIGNKNVYDKEIHNKSKKMIEKYSGEFIHENDKIDMVKKLYDKESLKETNFLKVFNESIDSIETLESSDISKSKAEQMLRNIKSIKVVPRKIYDTIFELFEQYKNENISREKNRIKREIEQHTVNVKISSIYNNYVKAPYFDDIHITDLNYDKKIGLVIKNDNQNLSIEERLF